MYLNEQLFSPGCGVTPCRCGKEMGVASRRSLPGGNRGHIRVYECVACHHEMHLTVWSDDAQSC